MIGKIELILGPIFSGKSTRLIEKLNKYAYIKQKNLLIKYNDCQKCFNVPDLGIHNMSKYYIIIIKYLKGSISVPSS